MQCKRTQSAQQEWPAQGSHGMRPPCVPVPCQDWHSWPDSDGLIDLIDLSRLSLDYLSSGRGIGSEAGSLNHSMPYHLFLDGLRIMFIEHCYDGLT